jgi:REP element-mobilizing transposase RayT
MSTKYQNKYRIPSARLQTWDYGNNASYFVTICTQHREHFFGTIVKTHCNASQNEPYKMQLNDIGKLVEHEWVKTPDLRPDMNLQLGEFVVMPNHFHAIIIIGENKYNTGNNDGIRNDDVIRDIRRDAMHGVSTITHNDTISHNDTDTDAMRGVSTINQFGPQSKNLASIIRGFKSSVTTAAKKMGYTNFAWQPRFHDHIIRDAVAFENIQNYIANNPSNWKEDKFNLV